MDKTIALEQYRMQYDGSLDYTLTDEGVAIVQQAVKSLALGETITFTFGNDSVVLTRHADGSKYVLSPDKATEATTRFVSTAIDIAIGECGNMVRSSCQREGQRH